MLKKYDIFHLNNHMYMIDTNPIRIGATFSILGSSIFDGFDKVAKILASTDPSLGLPLLPEIEEEEYEDYDQAQAVKEAQKYSDNTSSPRYSKGYVRSGFQNGYHKGYSVGYKAAKAKKYTEEDMEEAMFQMANYILDNIGNKEANSGKKCDEIIQSLNPLPIAVEVEIDAYAMECSEPNCVIPCACYHQDKPTLCGGGKTLWKPKVVNNIIQVKRWIYANNNS